MSGREDSNLRPPGPKPGALTGLRYAPNEISYVAVEEGFEPPVPVSQYDDLANRWFKPLTHSTFEADRKDNIINAFWSKFWLDKFLSI